MVTYGPGGESVVAYIELRKGQTELKRSGTRDGYLSVRR